MSCGNCHCSPCSCDDVCDPNNEPLASALNNFISSFFGTVGKTCVDNQVQWILPCDLNTGLPGFERRQGEGVACYLLRLFEYLNSLNAGIIISDEGVVIADPATQIDFVGDGVSATAAGGVVTVTITQPPPPSCAAFFDKIAINGECYDTWQAAYDANAAAAVPTLMLVGQGSTFGNLVLTGNYNSNIIIVGFGIPVSQLGTISGAGFTVNVTAHQITMGAITSSGAAITLSGKDVIYGAISSANAAGAGGAISVGSEITTGALTSTGTTSGGSITVATLAAIGAINSSGVSLAGGAVILGREVVGSTILASGVSGGTVTLGDECTITTITSKPLAAAGSGGTINVGDDCITGAIDSSGTVGLDFGGPITIGDRCETGSLTCLGQSGGAALTIGIDCQTGALDSSSVSAGNAGAIVIGRRGVVLGTINCNGFNNAGALTIGFNAQVIGGIQASGTNGTSGPIIIQDGGSFSSLTAGAGSNAGSITIGKFCTMGAINAGASGSASFLIIGDGTTIAGTITRNAVGTGQIVLGNSVTVTGDITSNAASGTSGGASVGRGCNLLGLKLFTTSGIGGDITVGAATTCSEVWAHTGGGAGKNSGNVILGSGATATHVITGSPVAGANSGNVTLEPGASCASIQVQSATGVGGNVTLKNSNVVTGNAGLSITMGTSNTGTILSINSKIMDQIDNVNGSSIFRDLVGSTPAANRDFIANLTADGAQFTNCLIVPHGTGVSINASAPRTVIAYQFLQKNAFPVNVTLSEGSETTSPNLLAP